MRDHPLVLVESLQKALGYDEAEAIVRARKDPASVKAIQEIDAARAQAKQDALAMGKDMAKRLNMSADQVKALVAALAADTELETWLSRRVNLTRAHERPPADDEHPTNQ